MVDSTRTGNAQPRSSGDGFPDVPPDFRSGFVALLGRTNVGKSTLLNKILGQKVSIVTPKPQTTRTRILGILHRPSYQIVFVDTPGIHSPIHRLGEVLVENAYRAVRDSDVNAFVVDATEGLVGEDIEILEKVYEKSKAPLIVAVNKIDVAPEVELEQIEARIAEVKKPAHIVPISALMGTNVDEFVDRLVELLPQGPPFFEPETITDQRPDEIAAEIIREKIIMAVHQEVPYHTAVEIEHFGPLENNPDILHIRATIIVARPGQKALVIGRGGKRIKSIGTQARLELEQIFGQKVFLELWVKVRKNWFENDKLIAQLGYKR